MLDPNERTLLFDALRPPDGYVMDEAIGTSFSLDLVALLAAPLGFTLVEWRGNPRDPWSIADSLAILRTLRRYAGRMSIFCDAARIAMPKEHSRLYTLLEESVVPVRAPTAGAAFHPKVWFLRFTPTDADGLPIRYRLIVSTRNLTFDRCMDVVAVLEGEYKDRTNGIAQSRPMANFVRALPKLGKIAITDVVRDRVERMAHEIHRTQFEAGPPFESQDFVFYALGLGDRTMPEFNNGARARLVMAPFLSDRQLVALTQDDADCTLISRGDSISALEPATRDRFANIYVPRQALLEMERTGENEEQASLPVSDLHAKVVVEEINTRSTRVTIGSANATNAAFNRNVEVLLALIGPTKLVGVSALMGNEDGRNDFKELWQPYSKTTVADPDAELEKMRAALDQARDILASCNWLVRVGTSASDGLHTCELSTTDAIDSTRLSSVTIRAWPVTLRDSHSVPYDAGRFGILAGIAAATVSAFWIVEIAMQARGAPDPARFVIRATLDGEPPNRLESVTQALIADQSALLRYLQLLLADDDAHLLLGSDKKRSEGEYWRMTDRDGDLAPWALLEPLLRALERAPERLDDIERLLSDLRSTEEGRAKLPSELDAVWPAVWAARGTLRA